MPSLYTFTTYSPEWPLAFQQEAKQLTGLLGDLLVTVHHIGSTSVPGLAAKPIIDLLPVVRDIAQVDEYTAVLEQANYKPWGEYGIPGRRFFTKDRAGYRTHNIHMFQVGDPAIERHLAFCAYLRNHPDVRDEYEALKQENYARYPADIAGYNESKSAWIKRIEQVALAWYRQRDKQVT